MPTKPKPTPQNPTADFVLPGGHAVRIALVDVTPDIARGYLSTQKRNRKPRKRHVDTLLRDITAGQWSLTPAGIVLDENGCLIDGQHRLAAIAASGQTLPLFVWHGWPAAAQDAMDMGAGRTVAEQLGLDGIADTNKLFSYVNNIALGFVRYNAKVTLAQTRGLLPLLPLLPMLAKADSPKCHVRSAAYLGIIGLALHIPGQKERVAKLFDAVTLGFGIDSESHPAHRIRTHYFNSGGTGGSGKRLETADYIADCVQAWCEGKSITAKPTGTGAAWLRAQLPDTYAQMRRILGFKS